MGTRNLTCVVYKGEYKVAQYGQWDGYPSGQGKTVLDFLLSTPIGKFKKAISECSFVDENELDKKWNEGEGFLRANPEFSRDTAAKVLELITKKDVRLLHNSIGFAGDSLFCEWAYVIDLDHETLEVYRGFNQIPLPEGARFKTIAKKGNYHPIKMIRKYKISELVKGQMGRLESELAKEERVEEEGAANDR